ncbi:MAG TPA: YciI family protein [Panacibacter sp.]|nr:YciI family protein [Panacibacter sp.]HNP43087.1 YciI family protein [Panacibacter sp.]
MRKIIYSSIACLWLLTANAQNGNTVYDKRLADSLGSDEYGMKMYSLVILKTGSNNTTDQSLIDSLFNGHMQNIGRLAKEGKLVVAGPLQKNDKSYRGIFILNVKTAEEAKALLETDPAVKSKLLDAEIYGWYGSAALPLYLPYHEKVQKSKF